MPSRHLVVVLLPYLSASAKRGLLQDQNSVGILALKVARACPEVRQCSYGCEYDLAIT